MKKAITHTLLTIVTIIIICNILPFELSYFKYIDKYGYEDYRHNPLTCFSWTYGVVKNDDKGGREVTPWADDYFNYISYYDVDCEPGDIILTIDYYKPFEKYYDGVEGRFDFNLGKISKSALKYVE